MYRHHTLTPLFFCIQNLMLPYPGLSGSACEYQDQRTSEKETCGETNEAPVSTFIYSGLQKASFGKGRFTALSFGTLLQTGRESGTETTA